MREDKGKKFVFWFIGLGSGMILSGIIILVLVLNTNFYHQPAINEVSDSEQEEMKEQLKTIQSWLLQISSKTEDQASQTQPSEEETTSNRADEKEEAIEELATDELRATVTVYIPSNITANNICRILEEKGIITDAKDFAKYIIDHQMTKRLKNGTIIVPEDATYEELLILLSAK